MFGQDNDDKSGIEQAALNRRKILLGSTTLVATSAIATSQPLQVALAQQPAASSGKKPNILVIFGDDIGQTNISAYSFGVVGYKTPNIDRIAKEGL
ncbi:MAG: arylsulfatase, partial [Xanthobacteraceae bacterium]